MNDTDHLKSSTGYNCEKKNEREATENLDRRKLTIENNEVRGKLCSLEKSIAPSGINESAVISQERTKVTLKNEVNDCTCQLFC